MPHDRRLLPPARLLALDLDGTVVPYQGSISPRDVEALHYLRAQGMLLICVTGRSRRSVSQVLNGEHPFHYVIFSTGAGLMEWPSQTILRRETISPPLAQDISRLLLQRRFSFMAHLPIPENHTFYFHPGSDYHRTDFSRRVAHNIEHAHPFPTENWQELFRGGLSQFLVVLQPDSARLRRVVALLPHQCEPVRVTSPLDHHSIWLEIFTRGVSKGRALLRLGSQLGIAAAEMVAVGNDYNDLSMLRAVGSPLVVSNAPTALRRQFPSIVPCDGSPVHYLVHRCSLACKAPV